MKIVLVEDDRTLRRFMGIALESMGYTIISYADVDKLFEPAMWEHVDVLLLDLILRRGKKNALELLQWLGDEELSVKKVILTGWISLRGYDDVLVELSDKIMSKPVDMTELEAVIESFRREGNARQDQE